MVNHLIKFYLFKKKTISPSLLVKDTNYHHFVLAERLDKT